MTQLLRCHPDVVESRHTSIPEMLMAHTGGTRWPRLAGADRVVWMLRYEPFRLQALKRVNYNLDRPKGFLPPQLYEEARRLYSEIRTARPTVLVSYEGMVGPLGNMVFCNALEQLGLAVWKMPTGYWAPEDANVTHFSFFFARG